jgi:hypothetical protein
VSAMESAPVFLVSGHEPGAVSVSLPDGEGDFLSWTQEYSRLEIGGTNSHAKNSRNKLSTTANDAGLAVPDEKFCRNCSSWLPLESFPPNERMHFGRHSWCRDCAREATRDWRRRNRKQINEQRRREYREAHPLQTRPCVVCGRPMTKPTNTLVCGEDCRRQRRIEQRRDLRVKTAS